MAERKRLNLGKLTIYERELTKLDVYQGEGLVSIGFEGGKRATPYDLEGRWNVSKDGAGRKGCRHR